MGELTRNFDWSGTSIGSPDEWPYSLRTTVSNILRSRFPMFLWWGEDMIQFYNDAYRPSLGSNGKHPEALGANGKDTWPETWPVISPLIHQVETTGEATWKENQLIPIFRNGKLEDVYWTYSYSAVLDDNGAHGGILVTCIETTGLVKMQADLQESEAKYRTLFESMDQGYCTLELFFEGDKCVNYRHIETNPTFERHLGMPGALGKTILEIAPDIEPKWFDLYGGVALTGNPIRIEEESRAFNKWFEVYAIRVGNAEERKVGVFFTDITKRKTSEQLLKDKEELLRTVFDTSPNSISIFEPILNEEGAIEDLRFIMVNEFTVRTTGRADLIGKRYSEAFPHAKETGVVEALIDVAKTGVPADFEKWYEGDGLQYWFRFIINRVGNLVVATVENITKRKEAENAMQESEAKLRSILNSAPTAMGVFVGPELIVENPNQLMIEVMAAGPDIEGKSFRKLLAGLVDEAQKFLELVDGVRTTGQPFEAQEVPVYFKAEKITRYFNISFIPLRDDDGEIYAVLDVSVDVTQQFEARQKLEEKEDALEAALEQVRLSKEAAELGTFDMDIEKGTMHWDDRCRTLFGISHHGPVTYEEDFAGGLHPDDRERVLEVINRLFIKSLSDGNYDVEYRTVRAEDGFVRWVRAKGKVYFDALEKPVRFIGSVLDITEKVMDMQKIEGLVEERTKELAEANETLQVINKELQRSNANLEEFAHAASHDLKEPVRKIHFFTGQLKNQLSDRMQENEVRFFDRIENATERMGTLIDDLLLYSHVSQRPHEKETVDLNVKVQKALEDLELDIEEKRAVVTVGALPVVQGYKRQLQQLFQNLISNALKYSKADVPPRVDISASDAEENNRRYHVISVRDNGIGFERQYEDKIFQMFARLHGKAEYSGTGVGLSIVKKVVENHNGLIRVESEVGEGSVFKVYLPA